VLENMQILNIKSNNKYSIITIVNWHTYQNVVSENEQHNEQQLNNSRTTAEQQMNTSKELFNNSLKARTRNQTQKCLIPIRWFRISEK